MPDRLLMRIPVRRIRIEKTVAPGDLRDRFEGLGWVCRRTNCDLSWRGRWVMRGWWHGTIADLREKIEKDSLSWIPSSRLWHFANCVVSLYEPSRSIGVIYVTSVHCQAHRLRAWMSQKDIDSIRSFFSYKYSLIKQGGQWLTQTSVIWATSSRWHRSYISLNDSETSTFIHEYHSLQISHHPNASYFYTQPPVQPSIPTERIYTT